MEGGREGRREGGREKWLDRKRTVMLMKLTITFCYNIMSGRKLNWYNYTLSRQDKGEGITCYNHSS